MASRYWDETLAARYREYSYEFAGGTLAGRVVVLAGGTGGLGAATASLLAREGARLVIGYRSRRERAETLARAIEKQCGSRPALVPGDIGEPVVRKEILSAAAGMGAPLAGVVIFPGDPARVAWEALDRAALTASAEANFISPILLARDMGEVMEKAATGAASADGSIVLLATMQAVAPFASSLNYAAPKAALVHAARVLAKQWTRVRVNVVAPGATVAGMAEASVSAGKYDAYVERGAIARFGRPEDVARAVRFFLEPDNYTTGQVLVVDGGLTLRRDA